MKKLEEKMYTIDWNKVKKVEDLITILKNLELKFTKPSKELKKLCKDNNQDIIDKWLSFSINDYENPFPNGWC